MAIPHLSVKVLQRSNGHSAVTAAAYAARETLYDRRAKELRGQEWTGKEDLHHSELLLPEGAPAWMADRSALWNAVELGEKRKDAQVGRTGDGALPRELSTAQQIELARGYLRDTFVSMGMAVDFAIHVGEASDGKPNPHLHFILSPRAVEPGGFAEKKDLTWNRKEVFKGWVQAWERHVNAALEKAGRDERISMLSHRARGLDVEPQKHLGARDSWLEKQGVRTQRGDINRRIRADNALKLAYRAQPERLPITVKDLLQERLGERAATAAIEAAAQTLSGLQTVPVADYGHLSPSVGWSWERLHGGRLFQQGMGYQGAPQVSVNLNLNVDGKALDALAGRLGEALTQQVDTIAAAIREAGRPPVRQTIFDRHVDRDIQSQMKGQVMELER